MSEFVNTEMIACYTGELQVRTWNNQKQVVFDLIEISVPLTDDNIDKALFLLNTKTAGAIYFFQSPDRKYLTTIGFVFDTFCHIILTSYSESGIREKITATLSYTGKDRLIEILNNVSIMEN